MRSGLQRHDLIQRLLRKSVTGRPVRIPFARATVPASIHVAGTAWDGAAAVAEGPCKGQCLALRREPGHVHDIWAIEVLAPEGRKLGYLPRRCDEIPARSMDAGKGPFLRPETVERFGPALETGATSHREEVWPAETAGRTPPSGQRAP